MRKWTELKKELLKNPATAREYERIAPEFELTKQIIELRLRKGLTQAQLAKKIGTQPSAVSRLESGSYNPSVKILQKVAKATDAKLLITLKAD